MAAENVVTFTDDNFQNEVLEADTPVLVDFWAEWCQPCRVISPTIDKLASEFEGRVKVGKLDIDNNQNTSLQLKIQAIPTVLIFKNGEVRKKFVGMTNEGDLRAAIEEVSGA